MPQHLDMWAEPAGFTGLLLGGGPYSKPYYPEPKHGVHEALDQSSKAPAPARDSGGEEDLAGTPCQVGSSLRPSPFQP